MTEIDPKVRAEIRELQRRQREAETRQAQDEAEARRAAQEIIEQKQAHLERLFPLARAIAKSALGNVEQNVVIVDRSDGSKLMPKRYRGCSDNIMASGWKIARLRGFESSEGQNRDGELAEYSGPIWNSISLSANGTLYAYAIDRNRGYVDIPSQEGSGGKICTVNTAPSLSERSQEIVRAANGMPDLYPLTTGSQYPLPHLRNDQQGLNASPLFAEPAAIERGLVEFVIKHDLEL